MFVVFSFQKFFQILMRGSIKTFWNLFLIIDMISVERRIFAFYIFQLATAQTTTQFTGQRNAYKRPHNWGFASLTYGCDAGMLKKRQSIRSYYVNVYRQSNIRRRLQRAFFECVSERWLHIVVRGNYSLKAFSLLFSCFEMERVNIHNLNSG